MTSPLAPRAAALLADHIEADAFADMYAAAPTALTATLGLQVRERAGATLLLAPGMPTSMFNRAIGLGMARDATLADVKAVMDAYREAGSTIWWLHWNPFATPADLSQQLPALGFTQPPRRSWAKMLRSTAAAPAIDSDLEITLARGTQIAEVTQAITHAFEMPPFMANWLRQLHGRPRWRTYAVTAGDRVVGGGCLFIDGDTAWLGMGAVLASHRRRGGQGALMTRRIRDAFDAGARYVVTETGEAIGDEPNPSLANMKRCGFETVAARLNFAGPTPQ